MAKKKIIITRKQLKRLSENEAKIVIPFEGNTPQQANAAYQNARGQIDYAESHATGGDVTVSLQGTGADENKPTQSVTIDPQNPNITNQLDPNLFNANPSVEVRDKEVTYEGKHFTKKQLEEARIANIKKNSRTYTKKSLLEDTDEWDNLCTADEVINELERTGDFYFISRYPSESKKSTSPYKRGCANSSRVQEIIFNEIRSAGVLKVTHEMDNFIMHDPVLSRQFEEAPRVIKVASLPDSADYFVISECEDEDL